MNLVVVTTSLKVVWEILIDILIVIRDSFSYAQYNTNICMNCSPQN